MEVILIINIIQEKFLNFLYYFINIVKINMRLSLKRGIINIDHIRKVVF